MRLRKLIIGVVAIGMPVAVMSTIVGVGAAQALVTGTGTLKCTKIAGTVTFKPPLKGTTLNNNTETQTYKLTATGCKPSGSNITKVTKGVVSQTIHTTDTSCHGLIDGSATGFNFTAVWTSTPAAANSGIAFSGDTPVVVGGKAGFKLPNTGGILGRDRLVPRRGRRNDLKRRGSHLPDGHPAARAVLDERRAEDHQDHQGQPQPEVGGSRVTIGSGSGQARTSRAGLRPRPRRVRGPGVPPRGDAVCAVDV